MTKFKFLFLFIFIAVTLVLLLMPRKGPFKRFDKNTGQPKPKLSYIRLLLLISAIVSFAILLLVRYWMEP